jgi:metallo-beta-lactamase class B
MGTWEQDRSEDPEQHCARIILLIVPAVAQELPKGVTAADLATNNKLFLELASKGLRWEEPAAPVQIAGPIYSVGTTGLGALMWRSVDACDIRT